MEPRLRAKIGLLPTGHNYYWDQFPGLKGLGLGMYEHLLRLIGRYVSVRCIPEERAKMDSDIAKYPIPIDMQSFWAETNVITSDYVRRSLQEKHHIRPGVVKHFKLD